jgi:hypothetical protein
MLPVGKVLCNSKGDEQQKGFPNHYLNTSQSLYTVAEHRDTALYIDLRLHRAQDLLEQNGRLGGNSHKNKAGTDLVVSNWDTGTSRLAWSSTLR